MMKENGSKVFIILPMEFYMKSCPIEIIQFFFIIVKERTSILKEISWKKMIFHDLRGLCILKKMMLKLEILK